MAAPKTVKKTEKKTDAKSVEALTHKEDKRKNIPTAEFQPLMREEDQTPLQVAYERRNKDLDPQLVWRGKDLKDWSDLVVSAPAIYIQEKVHPKVLIDDLRRQSERAAKGEQEQLGLFADFNGVPAGEAKTEFYQHDANWTNRMILGDSLQVMASLAEREGLRGKVQCIYIDPPYGIKFNSNFQASTSSRSVKDGNVDHITREPEQVKAFRDTWRDGINSYLTYLRDRLTVARDLLSPSGSVFLQIGEDNVHGVRHLLDEVFGSPGAVTTISFMTTTGLTSRFISSVNDYILWYARDIEDVKYRALQVLRRIGDEKSSRYTRIELFDGAVVPLPGHEGRLERDTIRGAFSLSDLTSSHEYSLGKEQIAFEGAAYHPGKRYWSTSPGGVMRLGRAGRLMPENTRIRYKRFLEDYPAVPINNAWTDIGGVQSRIDEKVYVVQTSASAIQRCILMTTDPGDLVLDPTCGSGTTAYVAEQWGRRWITIDTSRVALALARARIMGARYPYYLLADSRDGQLKEAAVTRRTPPELPTYGNIRQGFVYERVPHITLKSIANNAEIDVIWEKFQTELEPLREKLNAALKQDWQEWEIPREAGDKWPETAKEIHAAWWKSRIARQREIDASIAAKAEYEYLYDKPYEDNKKVRVAGPFTVESLSPHRTLAVDENDNIIDPIKKTEREGGPDFAEMVLENLKTAGVQQAHKEDRIVFSSLAPWPGRLVCAEGRYFEGGVETGAVKRAAILIGPEFGTVSRPDLVEAAREAADSKFDVLIACAFNYDAHSTEFSKLGRIPVLKARMNADLHMAGDLKKTDKANLFVIFGEPDIDLISLDEGLWQVKLNGVDVFDPNSGEVRSDNADGIACWFIDTDYNEESFFVRHAYFLGANDPYKALKTTLRAEINEEAWDTLHSDISRPFEKPQSGRIAVKVINHLGDEVMKVFRVG
jgi:adenine-specific DNA-methyltransferase